MSPAEIKKSWKRSGLQLHLLLWILSLSKVSVCSPVLLCADCLLINVSGKWFCLGCLVSSILARQILLSDLEPCCAYVFKLLFKPGMQMEWLKGIVWSAAKACERG